MNTGKLLVFSGPSGTGKSVITQRLTESGNFDLSISMTTRSPRQGEVDGVSYYFVSQDVYNQTVAEDGFFEHAEIYGNCYGTPKAPVLRQLEKGRSVILEIEMQGAMQVKKSYPDAMLIFVLPPSMAELRKRLIGRGTETPEQVETRLAKSLSEIRLLKNYEYVLVNNDVDEVVAQVYDILDGKVQPLTLQEAEAIIKKYEEE